MLALALACLLLAPLAGHAQQRQQTLSRHVRPEVQNGQATLVGAPPSDQRLNLAIILPPRNQAELTRLLGRLYDPASPDFHKFIGVDQFTQQFGPTLEDYQAVVDFAKASGFIVHDPPANRFVVSINGSVKQVESALHVAMRTYRHPTENRDPHGQVLVRGVESRGPQGQVFVRGVESRGPHGQVFVRGVESRGPHGQVFVRGVESRLFFSADRDPSLPVNLHVQHISGLNDFSVPRPMAKRMSTGETTPNTVAGSGPGGSYLGSDMRAAYYGGSTLTGKGQTVGLVEFGGYNPSDVDMTFKNSGQSFNVPIQNVILDGMTSAPLHGDDGEQVLDIVQAVGMAPGLSQVRVYIGDVDADIFNAIASENIAKQVSVSWSWSPEDPETDDIFFEEFAAQGQSVFVASGDSGEFDPFVDEFYPAEDAYVTAVGGTTLITNRAGGGWNSETAWNRSGGGASPDGIAIPAWQRGVANSTNGGSAALRNVPDVAMEADFDNDNCDRGQCAGTWAGTSFAAPRWAAFMALVNQQAEQSGNSSMGFLNPAIYGIGSSNGYNGDFHDVTIGNNNEYFIAPRPFFYAVTGYDLVTGWGSPSGQNLIDALAPPPTRGFQLSASDTNLIVVPGAQATTSIAVKNQSGFTGNVELSVSGLPSGITASFDINPASHSSALTLSAASSAMRGSYLLTVVGASGNLAATTSVALQVNAPGFVITPSPSSLKIYPGTSGAVTIKAQRLAGFSAGVDLAVTSSLPAGVTALWTNNSDGIGLLTLTAGNDAEPGSVMVTITGSSGNLKASTTIALSVNVPTYLLSISPIPFTLMQGSTATSTVTVVPWGDFAGTVDLSSYQLPPGVSASFTPASTSTTSVLTWSASSTAPPGTSAAIIAGNSGGMKSYSQFQQLVTSKSTPGFTVGVMPAYLTLKQGETATDNVTINEMNGYSGNVNLSVTQLPAGIAATFSPGETNAKSVLTLTANSSAAVGTYVVSVWASTGFQSALAPLYLTINPDRAFNLAVAPSPLNLVQGAPNTATISIKTQAGFSGDVSLAIGSDLPSGIAAILESKPSAGSAALVLSASNSVSPGRYFVNISGASGTQTVTTTLPFSVTASAAAATPTFSVGGGAYTSAQSVLISDATPGAVIYLTTDGSTPAANSARYSGPLDVTSTETIQAMAIASGYAPSAVATAAYTINIPSNLAPVIHSLSPAFCGASGPAFTLTIDGTGFTGSSKVYWGNTELSTQFVSSTRLTVQVTSARITSPGQAAITVRTSLPGAAISNSVQFEVDTPMSGTAAAPEFNPTSATISAGTTAVYEVKLPSAATSMTATCLNLPGGAACGYSSETKTVTIATSPSSPHGTFDVTVVFNETLPGSASEGIALPIFLLPLGFIRRRSASRPLRLICFLALACIVSGAFLVGCGGGSVLTSAPPPALTHQVTSSGLVSLTID